MAPLSYSSFSGIDIIMVVDNTVISTIQGISYSITREKAPIYTMGSANPRSFSRGKRGLAGSMIFTLFDRSALYQISKGKEEYKYFAHAGDPATISDTSNDPWAWAQSVLQSTNPGTVGTERRYAEYMDQIMPFNVTLIAQNEYGLSAWKSIIGIEILNEGGGLSVDDITNEEQCTYVARAATPWIPWSNGTFANVAGALTSGVTSVQATNPDLVDAYKSWLTQAPV